MKDNEKTNIFSQNSIVLDSIITTNARNVNNKKLGSINFFTIYEIDTIGRKLSLDLDYFDYRNTTNRIFKTQSFFQTMNQHRLFQLKQEILEIKKLSIILLI
ncbi:hypothetical protein LEQ04_07175 [Riemerella anatipestifer]|nr:hypothetical protein LEQ04_07175 [Riemerella anatipestifer]